MITDILNRDDYYELKAKTLEEGRLADAPVLFTPSNDEVKRLVLDDAGNIVGIRKLNSHSFTAASHGPIAHPFRLEITEEVLCIKAKKRPILLLTQAKDPKLWELIPRTRILDSHLKLGKVWLVLPLYSYKDEIFKKFVEHLYFPPFFPFVSNRAFPTEDCFGRFDRIQAVHMTLIEPSEYRLKNEVFNIIIEALISYLIEKEYGEIYPDFRRDLLGKLREQGFLV